MYYTIYGLQAIPKQTGRKEMGKTIQTISWNSSVLNWVDNIKNVL